MRPERLQGLTEDVEDKTHVTLYRRALCFDTGHGYRSRVTGEYVVLLDGLIIWPRGADIGETQRTAETNFPRRVALHARSGDSHVWRRFWPIPIACGFQPRTLRIRYSESLLRRVAEEREDTVHL